MKHLEVTCHRISQPERFDFSAHVISVTLYGVMSEYNRESDQLTECGEYPYGSAEVFTLSPVTNSLEVIEKLTRECLADYYATRRRDKRNRRITTSNFRRKQRRWERSDNRKLAECFRIEQANIDADYEQRFWRY